MPIIATRASAAYGAGFAAITAPPFALTGAYDALAVTVVPVGGLSSVTFSGIPAGYKHLELRCSVQTNRATYNRDSLPIRFNGDAGSSYSGHSYYGDGGGTTLGYAAASQINASGGTIGTGVENSGLQFGVSIVEILDYASTTKRKTIRVLSGTDMNGTGTGGIGGIVEVWTHCWQSVSAITSITFTPGVGTLFNRYSSFALYGVK